MQRVGRGPPPASTREPLAELPPKSFQHNLEELTRRLEAELGDRPRAAMIAYLFWHCAHPTITVEQYEERFAEAVDGSLADAAAGHSMADDSRCAATSGNDIMAAPDGARTWQGVRSHRAARSQCRPTSRLVGAGHRARARRRPLIRD